MLDCEQFAGATEFSVQASWLDPLKNTNVKSKPRWLYLEEGFGCVGLESLTSDGMLPRSPWNIKTSKLSLCIS